MRTTIIVGRDTRDGLVAAKRAGGCPSLDALVRDLLVVHRRARLREASRLMRQRMQVKGLALKDLIR